MFISIYATVILWEYLEEVDRKILTYFVRICHLFVNRILEIKSLDEIHKKILQLRLTGLRKAHGPEEGSRVRGRLTGLRKAHELEEGSWA
ncbi:hypothetical protein Glove_229g32 [Diversispora epigaea]|uniref:Uncharacterized protein n=1 Tax=Diversispora epigaea TaxID=1348612 RepID=A0A397ID30_9GLOM|nr:hypothetical protein Glove_229g32 [Diversispora epigaea]